MSTIFAVVKKDSNELPYYFEDTLITKCSWGDINYHFEPIAVRHNDGGFSWISPIADLLPPDTPVWALDNSPQGVYDIWDILAQMNKDERKEKYPHSPAIELLGNILPLIESIEPTLHPSIVGVAEWIKKAKQLLIINERS